MGIRVIASSRLREELASVMEALSESGAIIITHRGEGRAVLIDFDHYNELIDRLEYLEDSLDALAASWEGAVPLEELE